MIRQIDAERNRIIAKIASEKDEEFRLKQREWEEQKAAMQKAIEEAGRKGAQGSMQLQGEVAELNLEENLRGAFLADVIEPIAKGVIGADIRQRVKSPRGFDCGSILWEVKRTKSWSPGWVAKLKDDVLADKAVVGIIVSEVLPPETFGLTSVEGVWVCEPRLALGIGAAIRKGILDVAREKALTQNLHDKSAMLYGYVTGQDFKNQVEALVLAYQEMKGQIDRERAAMEKLWKARETQLSRVLGVTAGVVGSISAIVPLPEAESLRLGDGI